LGQQSEAEVLLQEHRIMESLVNLVARLPEETNPPTSPLKTKNALQAQFNYRNIGCSLSIMTMVVLLLVVFRTDLIELFQGKATYLTLQSTDQIIEQWFPDSSKVVLNKNSRVTYPADWTAANLELQLTGEAYFDFRPQTNRQIEVTTPQVAIRVIGTQFNVKVDEQTAQTEVFVHSGQISCTPSYRPQTYELERHQKVILNPADTAAIQYQWDRPEYSLIWLTQRFTFQDSPLRTVLPLLEQHYAATIKVTNDQILNCQLTREFVQMPLIDILDRIVLDFDFDLQVIDATTFELGSLYGCQ
ncbi:MAG: FecR family protein, partial [Bacteroidota bacterium]